MEDYSSTLEEVAYSRELDRLNQEIRDILDQIKKIKVERGVLDYFNKEIDISLLEKDISLLENKIKQGMRLTLRYHLVCLIKWLQPSNYIKKV
ncbi:MAG: hypothetical protein R3B55_02960 [Candidatus Paceibacterota bacterium]